MFTFPYLRFDEITYPWKFNDYPVMEPLDYVLLTNVQLDATNTEYINKPNKVLNTNQIFNSVGSLILARVVASLQFPDEPGNPIKHNILYKYFAEEGSVEYSEVMQVIRSLRHAKVLDKNLADQLIAFIDDTSDVFGLHRILIYLADSQYHQLVDYNEVNSILKLRLMTKFGDLHPARVDISGKRWFDRVNGNTYFSTTMYVDDKLRGKISYAYGYGEQYVYEGYDWLANRGFVPARERHKSSGSSVPPWSTASDYGFTLNYAATDVKRKKDL